MKQLLSQKISVKQQWVRTILHLSLSYIRSFCWSTWNTGQKYTEKIIKLKCYNGFTLQWEKYLLNLCLCLHFILSWIMKWLLKYLSSMILNASLKSRYHTGVHERIKESKKPLKFFSNGYHLSARPLSFHLHLLIIIPFQLLEKKPCNIQCSLPISPLECIFVYSFV